MATLALEFERVKYRESNGLIVEGPRNIVHLRGRKLAKSEMMKNSYDEVCDAVYLCKPSKSNPYGRVWVFFYKDGNYEYVQKSTTCKQLPVLPLTYVYIQ